MFNITNTNEGEISFRGLGALPLGTVIEENGEKYEVIDNTKTTIVTAKLIKEKK